MMSVDANVVNDSMVVTLVTLGVTLLVFVGIGLFVGYWLKKFINRKR